MDKSQPTGGTEPLSANDPLAILSLLQTRLSQTSESLDDLLSSTTSPSWGSLLNSLSVLGARFGALDADTSYLSSNDRQLLASLLVHPHTVPQTDPDLLPRVYLRTKPVPELSQSLQEILHSNPIDSNVESELESRDRFLEWAQENLLESLEPLVFPLTQQDFLDTRRDLLQESLAWMSSGLDRMSNQ